MSEVKAERRNSAFLTTQWTRVLQARGDSDESRTALAELCEAYYSPVHAFILREARDDERARDLTQEFFARIIQKNSIGKVDRARGRFRSYLLGAVKHFLNDMRDRDGAAKRNPGQPLESLERDTHATGTRAEIADERSRAPDLEFDRKWALAVLDRALADLQNEYEAEGKLKQFEILKPWLTGDVDGLSQASVAVELGVNESSVKVAIHRLRRRFRDLLKQQIAATLPEPDGALVADEMNYLVTILC